MLEEFKDRIENAKNKRYRMLERFHVGDTVYPFWLKNFIVYGTVIDIDTVAHKIICDFNGVQRQFCPEDLMQVNPVLVAGRGGARTAAKAGELQWRNSMPDGWKGDQRVKEDDAGEDADNGILCVCSKCGGKVGVSYNEKTGMSDFVCTSCGKRVPEDRVSRKCKESMRNASLDSAIAGMKKALVAAAAENGGEAGGDFGDEQVAELTAQYGGCDKIDEFAGWCEDRKLGLPENAPSVGKSASRIARRMLAADDEERKYLDYLKEFCDSLDDGASFAELVENDKEQEQRLKAMGEIIEDLGPDAGGEIGRKTEQAVGEIAGDAAAKTAKVEFYDEDSWFNKLVEAYRDWRKRRMTEAWEKEMAALFRKANDQLDRTGKVDHETNHAISVGIWSVKFQNKIDQDVFDKYDRLYEELGDRIIRLEEEASSGARRTAAVEGENPDNSEWQYFVLLPDIKIESGWKTRQEAEDRVHDLKDINIVGKAFARNAVPRAIDISDKKNWFKGKFTISKEDEGMNYSVAADADDLQESIRTADLDREVWEGWTPRAFIEELEPVADMIMGGQSWEKPFRSKAELAKWCRENQPYYKKNIPEVVDYFAKKYRLASTGEGRRLTAASELWLAAADVLEDGEIDACDRNRLAKSLLRCAKEVSAVQAGASDDCDAFDE